MDFEDICEAQQLEMDELFDEIEAILRSGTKLNFDYYIDKMIDEDRQAELMAYFQEEGLVPLDQAIEELTAEDFEEDEIKLMRLKYMADLVKQGKLGRNRKP
jgi:ATP-dependent DNA helicase RecQ